MDFIALMVLMLWPAIPFFWIPVHCAPGFFRRLGIATYFLPLVTWLPAAFVIYHKRGLLLSFTIGMPVGVNIMGGVLLFAGLALQIYTLMLLTFPGIMGMPEVTARRAAGLVTRGPFSIVRHPTYLSHTMMFLGAFLLTEVVSVGIVALLDAVVVNLLIIPLEERELLVRFGKEYEDYRNRVRTRFLPWCC